MALGYTNHFGHPLPAPPIAQQEGPDAASWTQPVPVVTPFPVPDGIPQPNSQMATNVPEWSGQMVNAPNADPWQAEGCMIPPLMPQTWFAERKFFSFWNTIALKDRHDNEWAYIETNLFDWANPFGFPGANMYLKKSGTNERGWKQFNDVWGADDLLFATSKSSFADGTATIMDCKGNVVSRTDVNQIYDHHGVKAGFYLTTSDFERNTMVIFDLAMPPSPMVRMTQSEPCNPFPPFCSTLPAWTPWLADQWEGEIIQKGYGQHLGSVIDIELSANGATDIRFLSMYGVHLFAPSRWSPLMLLILWSLFFCCCCGCCFRCQNWRKRRAYEQWQAEQQLADAMRREEEAALMEDNKNTVFLSADAPPSPWMSHFKRTGDAQTGVLGSVMASIRQ